MADNWKMEDVLPQNEEVNIKGKIYKLAPFSLDDAAYFEQIWNTADVVGEFIKRLSKSPRTVLCEIGYRLMTYDLDVEDCRLAKADYPTLKSLMRSMTEKESEQNNFMVKVLNAYGKSFNKKTFPDKEVKPAEAQNFRTSDVVVKSNNPFKSITAFFTKRNKKADV